jgi:acetyl esterase/lipase
MDPDAEVDFDFSPFLIRYKSGRVHRLMGTSRVGAGADAATGVTSRDVAIDAATGLAARLYIPSDVLGKTEKLPLLVYFHGGAFSVHSPFSRGALPVPQRARARGPRGGRVRRLRPRARAGPSRGNSRPCTKCTI